MQQHVIAIAAGAVLVWGTWVTTHATLGYYKAAQVEIHVERHHERLGELQEITREITINQAKLTGIVEAQH